jgi:SAM-dependent methyltransferase
MFELGADEAARLGPRLRAVGLAPRALAAWAGTDRLSALPARLAELAARAVTPASAALAAFVAGAPVRAAALDPETRAFARALHSGPSALVEPSAGGVRARASVLPLGPSLLVCDRADAPADAAQLCWPDDSSYHLARALPTGRRARWLDLGCGSGFAPLLRPELAVAIDAVDINPRAIAATRIGAALSGVGHLRAHEADLADAPAGPYDLVSCNAPIPGAAHAAVWRRAEAGLFARLWATAAARVAPGGMIVVHGALRERRAAPAVGERVVIAYTPDEAADGFGVLWWRPDAPPRLIERRRALSADRPHLDARDRDEALA